MKRIFFNQIKFVLLPIIVSFLIVILSLFSYGLTFDEKHVHDMESIYVPVDGGHTTGCICMDPSTFGHVIEEHIIVDGVCEVCGWGEICSGNCGANGDNVKWTLDASTGVLEISGTGDMPNFESPESVPWFEVRNVAKSIVLGGREYENGVVTNITSVGAYSFYGFETIYGCVIPNTVTRIGASAFEGCTSLEYIYIPETVASIASNAFKNCHKLTIFCYEGSYAHAYAKENGIPFRIHGCDHETVQAQDTVEATCLNVGYANFVCVDCGVTVAKNVEIDKNLSNHASNVIYIEYNEDNGCIEYKGSCCGSVLYEDFDFGEDIYVSDTGIALTTNTDYAKYNTIGLTPATAFADLELAKKYAGISALHNNYVTIHVINNGVINKRIDVTCDNYGNIRYSYTNLSTSIGTSNSRYFSSSSLVYSTKQEDVLNSLNLDAKNIIPNIDLGTYQLKSPYVEAFGEKFYFFDVGGEIKFDIGNGKVPVSVKVDSDDKTVRLMFGVYNEQTPEDNAQWSQTYKQIKDIYKTFTNKKVDTNELWRNFSNVRGKLKKHNVKFLVNSTCTVGGFLEGSFETGSFEFTGGGMFFELGIGGKLDAPLPPPFSAAYVAVGLKVATDGSIQLDYDNKVLSYYVQAQPNMELSAALGVGRPKVDFYIEGGIAGNLQAELEGATGIFANRIDTPFKAFLSGNLFVNGEAFGFIEINKKWPIDDKIMIYPRNDDIKLMSIAEEQPILDAIFESAVPLSRDYLDNVGLFAIDDGDKLYSNTSIYPYNAPELTALPNGDLMLLWIDDLGTKNDANKTSLMYSIYNGETWSEATELFETGTYNGSPVIYNDGEAVHILWNRARTALADDAGLKELIAEIELYYTCYENGEFSEPVRVTDNSLAELNYSITKSGESIAIVWLENSENNHYLSSGINYICLKEYKNGAWGEKQIVTSTSSTVGEINVYYENGAASCVYTVVNADGDSAIYNGAEQIGNGNCVQFSDGKLYYLDDNCITVYDIETGTAANTSLAGVSNFSISGGNVYALVSNGFTCELYENICSDGEFTEWEQVTEFGKYIRDYSVATDSLGEPVYALNLVDVTDGEIVYGVAELAVCKAAEINAIEVGAVYYDNDAVAPSATLPLSIDVYNVGNTAIDSLSVKITDVSGNELSSGVVEVSIAAGDVATVTYNYTLPQELSLYAFTVTVIGSANERNLEDNSAMSSVGYADIVLKDVVIEKTENGAVASVTLENIGYSTLTGVVVDVYDASFPDVILASIECGDIPVGGTYSFTYSLPEKYLSLEDKMTMYGLVFDAEGECAEAVYSNNAQKVVFGELTDCTVALIEGEEILTILAVDEFASYTLEEREGYIFKGWYTDEAFSADSKITEIPDNIAENILVFAKWIMLGDINEDDTLNLQDSLMALSKLLNGKTDGYHDMNDDGTFNLIDVIKVLKKVVA